MKLIQNDVLRQRSITGLIFAIVLIGLILSGKYGAMCLGVIILSGGTYEYIRMIFPNDKNKMVFVTAFNILFALTLILILPTYSNYYLYLLILSCISFIIGIVNLYKGFINHQKGYWLISVLYIGLPLGLFLNFIYNHANYSGFFWLAMFIMIWMSDSFAYLVGSKIGKRKLFEKISPKKSWEGFLGAGIITLPLAYFLGQSIFSDHGQLYNLRADIFPNIGLFWVIIACLAWVVGTMGDLVESSVKRTFSVKDSGTLLPGHGGILDRFDSFIYLLPFVLLLLFFYTQH
ncbi:MAG TPA: phosphatidate cytidylyltransferase [Saprospiraceae bacterium]|jgi:phosphatidate cytidylyltransferase|nr:phosphatidate cytidylyltransferase [Saprospiraceae bacterium]HRO07629.1 phosphatidate cytidylyltransferase [Saprospiraceae bacterium]HRO72184.1 phosphatidate cytidylyltransferase [Saprospiraceae bacterium]HRP40912.1 phosphatidate cytidylyltransferase [Saprospiraceae bacterium]